jgi:hypothetical protein
MAVASKRIAAESVILWQVHESARTQPGFEATEPEYALRTDQLGTQLDPPVHWASEYARGSYAVRPLGFKVADTAAWEEARPSSSRAPTGQGPA